MGPRTSPAICSAWGPPEGSANGGPCNRELLRRAGCPGWDREGPVRAEEVCLYPSLQMWWPRNPKSGRGCGELTVLLVWGRQRAGLRG